MNVTVLKIIKFYYGIWEIKKNLQFHKYLVLGPFILWKNYLYRYCRDLKVQYEYRNKDSGMFENPSYIEIFYHFS